jgi:hypothetical protein
MRYRPIILFYCRKHSTMGREYVSDLITPYPPLACSTPDELQGDVAAGSATLPESNRTIPKLMERTGDIL